MALRAAIEADLATAERLLATLGDQVRQVAELRRRSPTSAALGADRARPDDDEAADRADLAASHRGASTARASRAPGDARRR